MSDDLDRVEVWVEVPVDGEGHLVDDGKLSRIASKLNPAPKKKIEINNQQNSIFRRGFVTKEAWLAAELMKKAAESREAVESAVKGATHSKSSKSKQTARRISEHNLEIEQEEVLVPVHLLDTPESPYGTLLPYSEECVDVDVKYIFPCNSEGLVYSCSDLTGLTYMEEPNILFSLNERYKKNHIYTNVASILLAINPYQDLPLYDSTTMMKYRSTSATGKTQGTAPHIFAVAEEAFAALTAPFSLRRQSAPKNQSMIVCGESGSGKTESAKYLMRYLTNRTYDLSEQGSRTFQQSDVEIQVLEANVLLESLGNANTLLNNNSSRFGKFTKIYTMTRHKVEENSTDEVGKVIGAATETYLLEKSRVVRQNFGERNFHVFYQLTKGASPELRGKLELGEFGPEDFHYTNQGETFSVNGIDDVEWFSKFRNGLSTMKISEERQEELLSAIVAILHIGNVNLITDNTTDDGCIIAPDSIEHLEKAAKLLGIDHKQLETRLITANVKVVREVIAKKLNPRDAIVNRDSICRSFYNDIFNWVVDSINDVLSSSKEYSWIGILDVFGFECFENNSFEQFCINFANERLQQHFNFSILLSEQREYAHEGILWESLEVPDNQDTIEMVSTKVTGVLALLDSTCKLKSAAPDAFVTSVMETHKGHRRLKKIPNHGGPMHVKRGFGFGIEHYAGIVYYNADEFLLKNTDNTDPDTVKLFNQSNRSIIRELVMSKEERLKIKGRFIDKDKPDFIHGKPKKGPRSAFSSVSSTFSSQLTQLMEILISTQSYFIRCVKPNTKKAKGVFDPVYVRPQLKCGGLVEAVKMLKRGYPTRVSFEEIYRQYSPLLNPQPVFELNKRDFSQAVLSLFELNKSEYQLGLTKVFFKAGRRALLESVMNRDTKLSEKDMDALMGFLMKKRWQRILATVKSNALFSIRLRQHRSVHKFFFAAKIGIIYRKTFYKLMMKVLKRRREASTLILQSAFLSIVQCRKADRGIADIRAEKSRLEALKRKQQEEEQRIRDQREKKRLEREAYEAEEAALKEKRKREQEELEREEQRRREERQKQEEEEERRRKEDAERRRREEEEEFNRRRAEQEAALAAAVAQAQAAAAAAANPMTALFGPAGANQEMQNQLLMMMQNMLKAQNDGNFASSFMSSDDGYDSVNAPIPDEDEIRWWVENLLSKSLDSNLFDSLADGVVILKIIEGINPAIKFSIHDQKTSFTIKDHFHKFNHALGLLGIHKSMSLSPDCFETPEGKL